MVGVPDLFASPDKESFASLTSLASFQNLYKKESKQKERPVENILVFIFATQKKPVLALISFEVLHSASLLIDLSRSLNGLTVV